MRVSGFQGFRVRLQRDHARPPSASIPPPHLPPNVPITMTKHSRNNTANSVFSYAEYKKLSDYGTKKQRLGIDSMKRFDACTLCLQQAREPVACQEGHLYCKECIYTDLLSQKKDIKRFKAKLEELAREEEAEKARAAQAARERVLRDFERGQLGLASRRHGEVATTSNKEKDKEKDKDSAGNNEAPRGVKRPASTAFEFDLEHAEELARRAEIAALKQLELEQKEARKSKLPSAYWLASETPTAENGDPALGKLKDMKVGTLCRATEFGHPLNLKSLIPVKFATQLIPESSSSPPNNKDNLEHICPSCKKTLNLGIMFLMRPCSHVLCKTCTDTLAIPNKQCVTCDAVLPTSKDVIQLSREGTGFSGGGRAETKKVGGFAFSAKRNPVFDAKRA
ncbi:Nitric oxide synthase-interacting protein [Ceratobasidium theobromae]|uniref:Nitric oxide synthase-interacting protein n=1 Tax=Ceratobasidium theobromae TaxID=1582974 RepID=A0A5N5QBD1_9AGAM|nr:Nitric oxide synthase-interacting protein [Ceratobasidium theobromae]